MELTTAKRKLSIYKMLGHKKSKDSLCFPRDNGTTAAQKEESLNESEMALGDITIIFLTEGHPISSDHQLL